MGLRLMRGSCYARARSTECPTVAGKGQFWCMPPTLLSSRSSCETPLGRRAGCCHLSVGWVAVTCPFCGGCSWPGVLGLPPWDLR